MAAQRQCPRCRRSIPVGKQKVGRTVFAGGVCYDCHRRTRPKKLK